MLAILFLLTQTITYQKSFPGSSPAFVKIDVQESGEAEYNDDPKSENPVHFQVTAPDRAMLKELAQKLDNFKRPLESPAKVAFMGMKTFHFDNGTEQHEAKFNYSEDPDARALADWFEKVIETEQERLELETSARFEKLGVEKALLRIEISWENKRLIAPEQFLPMLDKIQRSESYMHMARSHAAGLSEHIRGTVK